MRTTRRALIATGALLFGVQVVLSGCSAEAPDRGASPTASASAQPADSWSLRELGFANGPANFWLPAGTTPTTRIDQVNVVTLTFEARRGPELAKWLRTSLLRSSWTIEADSNDQLLFSSSGWSGAFTTAPKGEKATMSALTLRKIG